MISPSGASIRRLRRLVQRNRRLSWCLALLTSVVAGEGEPSASQGS